MLGIQASKESLRPRDFIISGTRKVEIGDLRRAQSWIKDTTLSHNCKDKTAGELRTARRKQGLHCSPGLGFTNLAECQQW